MTTATNPLTDTQMLVLKNAHQRSNLYVLPLPPSVKARGGAKRQLLSNLIKLNLIQEMASDDASVGWRTDDQGQHYVLQLTPQGLLAACPPGELPTADAPAGAAESLAQQPSAKDDTVLAETREAQPAARVPTGKLGQVLQAISADAGATLSEITTLTGWLPHTARAALTGLRQRGFSIELGEVGGRKAYRQVAAS